MKLFDITFETKGYDHILNRLRNNQLMVVPAAPPLSQIDYDRSYYSALKKADFAIPDSSLMVILYFLFYGKKINKMSGLRFLKLFLREKELKKDEALFLIDPNNEESESNRIYLKKNGIQINTGYQYIAPMYNDSVKDDKIVAVLESLNPKPKYLLINIGGGVQEELACYIKGNLSYNIAIVCTGAAISFLTGQQAKIPKIVDTLYLGWFVRIIRNPIKFFSRYFFAFRLIYIFYLDKFNKL